MRAILLASATATSLKGLGRPPNTDCNPNGSRSRWDLIRAPSQEEIDPHVGRSRAVGNPKFRVGDSFPGSPPRPVVTAEYAPQTIGLRAKALNCRRIVGVANPGRLGIRT